MERDGYRVGGKRVVSRQRKMWRRDRYWHLFARLAGQVPPEFDAKVVKRGKQALKVINEAEAKQVVSDLEGASFVVSAVAKKERKAAKGGDAKKLESLKRKIASLETRLHKKQIAKTDKEENKTIALGTSKLNYLDPRISIAWCRRYNVPIDKDNNKTERLKVEWAMQMTERDFQF